MRYLHHQYGTQPDALRQVAVCMASSGFLAKHTLVLEKLTTTPIGEVLRDVATDVAKAIARAIGPSPRLKSALNAAGASVPAFGLRRLRRYV